MAVLGHFGEGRGAAVSRFCTDLAAFLLLALALLFLLLAALVFLWLALLVLVNDEAVSLCTHTQTAHTPDHALAPLCVGPLGQA